MSQSFIDRSVVLFSEAVGKLLYLCYCCFFIPFVVDMDILLLFRRTKSLYRLCVVTIIYQPTCGARSSNGHFIVKNMSRRHTVIPLIII